MRNLAITKFNIEKLALIIKCFNDCDSINEISEKTGIKARIIKKNLEYADTDIHASMPHIKCENCNNKIFDIKQISLDAWYETKMNLVSNPQRQKMKNSIERFEPIMKFYNSWLKKHRYINKKIKRGLPLSQEEMKYQPKVSAEILWDAFRDENKDNKNIFIPTLQGFYDFIDREYVNFEYDLLIRKSKKGLSDRKWKETKCKRKKTTSQKIQFGLSIHDRPVQISNRSEFGHFEFDTVIFQAKYKYCLVTLLERKTRMLFVWLSLRDAKSVRDALKSMIKYYDLKIKSLTIDNGSENVRLNEIDEIAEFYKCNPYSSSEKGSIENAHKWIRYFIPKGKKFSYINLDYIIKMTWVINNWKRNYRNDKTGRVKRLRTSEYFYSFC
ncbi:IS30 family transposase [Mycoplasma sp. Z244B]|uniref:IS30 family transposase n=1 Tax=Mycoplasma sp. Z244B TaxID=3401659 RepID=UPI003AAD2171